MNEGPVEAHCVEETKRGYDRVTVHEPPLRREEKRQNKPIDDPSLRREEKRQNKPTAVARTMVKMEPCALRPVGSKATVAHSIR